MNPACVGQAPAKPNSTQAKLKLASFPDVRFGTQGLDAKSAQNPSAAQELRVELAKALRWPARPN